MLFDKNSIAVGSANPLKTRVLLRQGEQTLDVPAAGMGLPLVDGNNTFSGNNLFTGTNEFDGTTNFDGATDFDGANVFDGAVTFNSVPSLVGGAILFPATQVPSANANALDDYEENTWTPTIAGTTLAGAGTYTVQDGIYLKIGRGVFFEAALGWSAHTGTGNILVASLPFTSRATFNTPVTVLSSNLTFAGQLVARVLAGTTTIQLHSMATGAALAAVAMDTSASVVVSGWYQV